MSNLYRVERTKTGSYEIKEFEILAETEWNWVINGPGLKDPFVLDKRQKYFGYAPTIALAIEYVIGSINRAKAINIKKLKEYDDRLKQLDKLAEKHKE